MFLPSNYSKLFTIKICFMASLGSNQFHSQISNLHYIPTEKTQIKSIHVHDPKEKTNHLFAHNGGILRLKLYPSVQ